MVIVRESTATNNTFVITAKYNVVLTVKYTLYIVYVTVHA